MAAAKHKPGTITQGPSNHLMQFMKKRKNWCDLFYIVYATCKGGTKLDVIFFIF